MRTWVVAMAVGTAMLPAMRAHADFVLGNSMQANTQTAISSATPSSPDLTAEAPEQTVPRFKAARGFGDAIPMGFAVRQIVPSGVRVRYGAGIDPQTRVSWKGDRPWNQALAAAVHPLHLRLVTGIDTVLITR
jgi:hypothetical protein